MADTSIIRTAQIVSNGGEITSDRYVNDSSNDLAAGELCYLSGGTIVPVATSASKLENDASPFDAAAEYFISLEDVDVSEDLGGYVAVQKVDADTVLEGYVVDAATGGDVVMDTTDIGTVCEGYVDASGKLGVNNATTKGVFKIVDVMDNYEPYQSPSTFEVDADGTRHDRVRFSIIGSKVL